MGEAIASGYAADQMARERSIPVLAVIVLLVLYTGGSEIDFGFRRAR
jgi:hypothetical protein